jgi:hypothetical protein
MSRDLKRVILDMIEKEGPCWPGGHPKAERGSRPMRGHREVLRELVKERVIERTPNGYVILRESIIVEFSPAAFKRLETILAVASMAEAGGESALILNQIYEAIKKGDSIKSFKTAAERAEGEKT